MIPDLPDGLAPGGDRIGQPVQLRVRVIGRHLLDARLQADDRPGLPGRRLFGRQERRREQNGTARIVCHLPKIERRHFQQRGHVRDSNLQVSGQHPLPDARGALLQLIQLPAEGHISLDRSPVTVELQSKIRLNRKAVLIVFRLRKRPDGRGELPVLELVFCFLPFPLLPEGFIQARDQPGLGAFAQVGSFQLAPAKPCDRSILAVEPLLFHQVLPVIFQAQIKLFITAQDIPLPGNDLSDMPVSFDADFQFPPFLRRQGNLQDSEILVLIQDPVHARPPQEPA